jgi:glycosyltransferase involved in cell wall biosynthesis
MNEEYILPTISIIVPVYKAEDYLSDCIESILSQTYTDFELILVNDGSPDNSGVLCDSYALKDSRIRVIHKTHGGASSARNAGVETACGKYIGWVDADDRIAPDMYEKLHNLAERYNADITGCQYLLLKGNQTIRSGKEEPIVYGGGDLLLKQFFNAYMKPNLFTNLYKRETWNGIRFPKGRNQQDCYVNMRFALMPLVYVRTSEPLYYYIERKNSITTTYTSSQIRQAIYLYEYTMYLAVSVASSNKAKKYLTKDAINRLMGRFYEVSMNSDLKNQNVYNYYMRKKLGFSLIKYIMKASLPFKTRISYSLLLLNLKSLQGFFNKYLGQK